MTINNESENVETNNDLKSIGVRHIQVVLLFFLLAIGVGMRMQLSVAVVAMTDKNASSNPDIPTYDWDNKSVILSSFYWGYLTLQLIAGSLGRLYGTKYFLVGAMFCNATASMLVPFLADKLGSYGVMTCRILQGIAQGFFYPSVYNLLGRWTPISERSRLGSIALAGYSFGSIVTNPLVGFMSSSSWGWPSTFYLFGGLGYAWMILWSFFGASSPAEHKSITIEERHYIETSFGKETEQVNIPWKGIFTSIPIAALTLAYIGLNWVLVTLGTETPTYLSGVMGFDIQSNSLLSSVPSVAMFISGFFFGWLSDFTINKNYFSRSTTRKMFTTIASMGSALPLLVLCFLPADAKVLSVTMLVICGFFYSATNGGSAVNQMDLSPRFAGIIMAICNSVANAIGLIAPLIVQAVVGKDEGNRTKWRIVFLITASLVSFTNLMYIFFASAEVQPWNSYGKNVDEKPASDDARTRKISRKISMVMSNL